jgi:hypothetical protein
LLLCVFHQGTRGNSVSGIECSGKCAASADSFSDYGQFVISDNAVGHILYSARTAQSTMDFSTMSVEDGVVDSPPNSAKRAKVVRSPSPMKCASRSAFAQDRLGMNPETQRKLYDDEMLLVATVEVWCHHSFHLAIQSMFGDCE